MKNSKIFIIGHKPIEYGWYEDNALYEPIQVGFGEDMLPEVQRDNTGQNISKWNAVYAESTATYWIWKNAKGFKYLGQCQYRRRLHLVEDIDFDDVFHYYDAIVPRPLHLNPRKQYMECHSRIDMDDFKEAVTELYPEMVGDFDRYITNGKLLYYSNSFVLKSSDYKDYCKFLFSIINYIKKKRGYTTPEKAIEKIKEEMDNGLRKKASPDGKRDAAQYSQQVFGFLSERIFTLWVQSKCPRRFEINYEKYEGV